MQMLVSGGVDSTVCAALLHKALKEDQVIAVHVDNGFMRKDESRKVEVSLKNQGLKLKGTPTVAAGILGIRYTLAKGCSHSFLFFFHLFCNVDVNVSLTWFLQN